MKKPLIVIGALVLVAFAVHFVTQEEKPGVSAIPYQQAPPATIQQLKANGTIPSYVNAPLPGATSKPADAESATNSAPAAPVEQTQNAVDFNAPGAGTADQKAGAAAAAGKAYRESQGH